MSASLIRVWLGLWYIQCACWQSRLMVKGLYLKEAGLMLAHCLEERHPKALELFHVVTNCLV